LFAEFGDIRTRSEPPIVHNGILTEVTFDNRATSWSANHMLQCGPEGASFTNWNVESEAASGIGKAAYLALGAR